MSLQFPQTNAVLFDPQGRMTRDGRLFFLGLWQRSGEGAGNFSVSSLDGGSGATSSTFFRGDGVWATPSYPTAANPSASVGTSAVNGSAATFMRSDAAPALNLSIAPTWTAFHTFSAGLSAATVTATGAFGCNGKTAQSAAAVAAAVSGTAGGSYTGTEQTLINDLKTLTNQLRAALVANGICV
jgi:hypothetical protein